MGLARSTLAVLAAAVALGGCGLSGADKPKPKPGDKEARTLAKAVQLTAAERTARTQVQFRTLPEGRVDFTATGLTRLDREATRLRLDFRRFEGLPAGTRLETIVNEGDYYVRERGQRRWTLLPEDEPPFVASFGETLPFLGAIVGRVRKGKKQDVRGVQTTAYRATVALDLVDENLPPARQAAFRVRTEQFVTDRVPITAYLDSEGRLRRMAYRVPELTEPRAGGDVGVASRTDFFDFGAKGDTGPPPPKLTDRP